MSPPTEQATRMGRPWVPPRMPANQLSISSILNKLSGSMPLCKLNLYNSLSSISLINLCCSLYLGEFKVKTGDKVNRGQLIAEAGTRGTTKCSGTIEHLHLQTSKEGPCRKCTGSWKYLGKKQSWTNPHKHWTGGKGKPQCFVADIEYPKKLLTLPFQCKKI